MAWHTFRLAQNSAVLLDLTNCAVQEWESNPSPEDTALANDNVRLGVAGATFDAMAQLVTALNNVLRVAELNNQKRKGARPYVPIYLEVQPLGATYALQTEVLGGKVQKEGNWLSRGLRANFWDGLTVDLVRRAHFDETSETTLINAQSYSNNFGAIALAAANLRGDLPFPFYVEVNPGATGDDRVAMFLKADDTPASFVPVAQVDTGSFTGYSIALGAEAANLVDGDFANGNGTRITPTGTTLALRARVTLDANIAANMSYARVWVRCRDNDGSTPLYQLQARFFAVNGGVYEYGDWLENKKKVTVVGGTTALPVLDLGWGKVCPPDTAGLAPPACGVEIYGVTTDTNPYSTFDIDEVIFAACDEGGVGPFGATGLVIATMPAAMTSSLRGVIDAQDRVPPAYLVDGSGNFKMPARIRAGNALFGHPKQDQRLFVATLNSVGNRHQHNVDNSVTVKTRFRYKFWRG